MTSMIERVARAIEPGTFSQFESLRDHCLRNGDDHAEALGTAEWAHGHDVRRAMEKARAAIEAMREPTLEMLDDGNRAFRQAHSAGISGMTIEAQIRAETSRFGAGWRAAIDAALNEKEGGDAT